MADLNYTLQGFEDGDTLAADNLIDIEEAIINNQTKINEHTTSISNNTSNITSLQSTVASNTNSISTLNAAVASNVTLIGQKLDKTFATDEYNGKILYVNEKQIDYRSDYIKAPSIAGLSLIEGVDYFIGQEDSYIHYKCLNGKLEQIGSAEEGKIYRVTYGQIFANEVIEGVPADVDPKYVLRLWEIKAQDFSSEPTPNLDGNWSVVNTLVIGADIERSIINARLTENNINSILWSKVQNDKQKVTLSFKVNSTSVDGEKTYALNYVVKLRGTTIAQGELAQSSIDHEVTIDVTKKLLAGQNIFEISFEDRIGSKDFISHTINCADLTATPQFDDKKIYYKNQENVVLRYIVRGQGLNKTTYLYIYDENNRVIKSDSKDTTNDQASLDFTIPTNLEHGRYLIKCYSSATVGKETISTDVYSYDMIIVDNSVNKAIIGSSYRGEILTLKQYSSFNLAFYVYDGSSETPKIIKTVKLNGENVYGPVVSTMESNVGEWNYKFNEIGTYQFLIQTEEADTKNPTEFLEIQIEVQELKTDAVRRDEVQKSLIIDFDSALGKEFSETTKVEGSEVVKYKRLKVGEERLRNPATNLGAAEKTPIYFSANKDFDWIRGGYQLDAEDGKTMTFVIKAGDSITINKNLFGPHFSAEGSAAVGVEDNGLSLKMIFKVLNATSEEEPFINCYKEAAVEREITVDGVTTKIQDKQLSGLKMYPQEAYFYLGYKTDQWSKLHLPYSEEDKIDFCLTLSPSPGKGGSDGIHNFLNTGYAFGYEDGAFAKAKLNNNYTLLESEDSLVIGSDTCDIVIYRLKLFSLCLSEEEVLTEYILDGVSSEEIIERDERNHFDNSYDFENNEYGENYGNFFEDLSSKYPDLRFILIDAPVLTKGKGSPNKVKKTTVKHWYKGGREIEDNWIATGATHVGQGTSSNNYGAAARNIDIDLKDAEIRSMNKDQVLPNITENHWFSGLFLLIIPVFTRYRGGFQTTPIHLICPIHFVLNSS